MFLFLNQFLGRRAAVTQRLILNSTPTAKTPFILSNILPYPISYAEVPTGYVFMANGLMPMTKWDGLSDSSITVGVVKPSTAVTISGSGTGLITGIYTAYVRWIDKDGNPSNFSPISAPITLVGASKVTYTHVPLTSDPKVVRVQLLRNTSGQANVYYVDIDSTDLTGTTSSSVLIDSFLQVQEAVPLFDSDGKSVANRFTPPPNHKPFLIMYQGRLFAYGETEYTEGHAECTFGSKVVPGIGTSWNKSMEGRFFYVVGSPHLYQIDTVDDVEMFSLRRLKSKKVISRSSEISFPFACASKHIQYSTQYLTFSRFGWD